MALGVLSRIFHFSFVVSCLLFSLSVLVFALHGLLCAGCRSPAPWVGVGPGRWLRQSAISAKGELLHPPQFSLVFPYICLIVYFETFYSSCICFFLPYVGKVRAQGRGGAHPHATTVAAAVHTQRGGMRVALSRTDIGLLAQPESVLALAPPLRRSCPGFASLWLGRGSGRRPLLFSLLVPSRCSPLRV